MGLGGAERWRLYGEPGSGDSARPRSTDGMTGAGPSESPPRNTDDVGGVLGARWCPDPLRGGESGPDDVSSSFSSEPTRWSDAKSGPNALSSASGVTPGEEL